MGDRVQRVAKTKGPDLRLSSELCLVSSLAVIKFFLEKDKHIKVEPSVINKREPAGKWEPLRPVYWPPLPSFYLQILRAILREV